MREREQGERARARVLWTAYWALVLCGWALSSSCPCFGRAPELCGWALWPGSVSGSFPPLVLGEECGRTNSDVNADNNLLIKQFALGVKVGRTKKSIFD